MKQDRNGARTAQDIERKYDFSSIKKAIEQSEKGITKINQELDNFINETTSNLEGLQSQIDGNITTYFYSGVPTLSNLPASEWETAKYNTHLGDLYYDNDTGKAYRFAQQGNTYLWVQITDTDVTEALELASKAKDTADSKRTVFTSTPFVPYDIGDLWLNNQELYVCDTPKTSTQTYDVNDFKKATKYTDDTALNTFINGDFAENISAINEQVDKKSETWYQNEDPSLKWTTTDLKKVHVGDLWYKISEEKNYVYTSSYTWAEIDGVPDNVYDQIDGKAQIFTSQPTTPYYKGDLYTQGTDGDILVCKTDRLTGNYNADDWIKAGKYTDDTALNNFVNVTYKEAISNLTNQIDGKINTYYYSGAPTLTTLPAKDWSVDDYIKHTGDLYYDKETGYAYMFQVNNNVYSWEHIVDKDLTDALALANAAKDTADSKRRIFVVQPTPPYDNGDLWLNNEELYVCQIAKASGTFADNDFIIATKYTDDTLASQVGNELTVVKGQVTTINEKANGLEVVITENTSLINSLTGEVAEEIDTRAAMIRLQQEAGIPVVELGTTESPVKTKYKNDGMYIEENGSTTSYFKNGKAYNYDMEAINSLTIGRFACKPRENGNLSLVYIGTGGDNK
ncbi:MAG: hypothetical protein J6D28_04630 [Bacilli bacterium]|nr:hypothetical protein [Bacilli bacterium]